MPDTQAAQPFVVSRRRLEPTTAMLYVGGVIFALMVLLTLGCIVVALVRGDPVREPLEAVWLSWSGMPLIFAVGLPVLILVGVVTTAEARAEAKQQPEEVVLSIDADGIYLGGSRPQQLHWPEIQGICRVERLWDNGEGGLSWHPHLVVMLLPEDQLPRDSSKWGPSRHWPGTAHLFGHELPYDDLVAAVRQHAPQVPVTDRGRVPDEDHSPSFD